MSARRVVITGLGIVSPLGNTVKTSWDSLLRSECAIKALTDTAYDKLPCKIAATIPHDVLNVEKHFTKSDLKQMAPSTVFALIAAKEALGQAKWTSTEPTERDRTGVAIGVGMIDLNDVCATNELLKKSYNRVSPYFVPRILPNMAAGHLSIKYGFRGPNHSVSTACATGAHSIGDAFRFIRDDEADVMVCGGAESCIGPLAIAGFSRLRALSTMNEDPAKASRPFDRDRNGFVMGEGSAILILEELEHALQRNAEIVAEVLGYGLSGDASHLTSPSEDGIGAQLVMERAVKSAQISLKDVTYINAHATSTPIGDAIEIRAIKNLFGDHASRLFVSSTKGAHGHLLGSAGNLEAAFTALACKLGTIPPTINLENIPAEMDGVQFVRTATDWVVPNDGRRIALKNAFGFGGTNACLCIGEYK